MVKWISSRGYIDLNIYILRPLVSWPGCLFKENYILVVCMDRIPKGSYLVCFRGLSQTLMLKGNVRRRSSTLTSTSLIRWRRSWRMTAFTSTKGRRYTHSPVARLDVGIVCVFKPQTHLNFTFQQGFGWRVRFRHKPHLIMVRKGSCLACNTWFWWLKMDMEACLNWLYLRVAQIEWIFLTCFFSPSWWWFPVKRMSCTSSSPTSSTLPSTKHSWPTSGTGGSRTPRRTAAHSRSLRRRGECTHTLNRGKIAWCKQMCSFIWIFWIFILWLTVAYRAWLLTLTNPYISFV